MTIHVFILDVTAIKQYEPRFVSLLNDSQQACYKTKTKTKTKTKKRKTQYIFSRLLLRYALSYCVGQPISAVDIVEVESGKPESLFAKKNNLHFGLSHSGHLYGVVIMASAKGQCVGIDIECLKPVINEDSIEFFCNKNQKDVFFRLSDKNDRISYYYQLWTQKEAWLKAAGSGVFSDKLKSIQFINANEKYLKPKAGFIKTAFLNRGNASFEDGCLSICADHSFEWRVFRVFADELALRFECKDLLLSSRDFIATIDE